MKSLRTGKIYSPEHPTGGGYVCVPENLDQEGTSWVHGNARIGGKAFLTGNAQLYDRTTVRQEAWVGGNASLVGDVWVYGRAKILGLVAIKGYVFIYDDAVIDGGEEGIFIEGSPEREKATRIYGNARIEGGAKIINSHVYGYAIIRDYARLDHGSHVFGDAQVAERAWLTHGTRVYGDSYIWGDSYLSDCEVFDLARVCCPPYLEGKKRWPNMVGKRVFGSALCTKTNKYFEKEITK
jgi:carbonic anhydrase/acetyltransferase-like protein (isoleucine patch superfamily)